jgi:hypothetical protein
MLNSIRNVALACALTALAGYIDAIGFLHLGGLFVSFMSGNSTRMAVNLAAGHWRSALVAFGLVTLFVTGAGVGYGVLAPAAIPPEAFVPVPTPSPPSPEAVALAGHLEAVAGFADRSPGSPGEAATLRYISDVLADHGGETSVEALASSDAEWLDAAGGPVDQAGVFPIAVAVTPAFAPGGAASFSAPRGRPPRCAAGLVLLRVPGYEAEAAAFDYLDRCAPSGTTAALAVRVVDDATWKVVSRAASIRLAAGRIVWASVGSPTETTPLVVVPTGSTGPGAAQSAAPIAVALELAAKADAAGRPLRLAFADLGQRGLIAILLRRVAERMPGAPVIELGPLGGRLGAVLGSRPPGPIDPAAAGAGLLGSVVADEGAAAWLARTQAISEAAAGAGTSDELLAALAGGAVPAEVGYDGLVATSALPLGIDAAYLGEPTGRQTETGGPADTPAQVDGSALEHALTRLASALEVLDGR